MKIKDPKKTKKIIQVTAQMIVKNNNIDISTSAIAKKVGIAQSNIYIYFKSKQDLIEQVYLDAFIRLGKFAEKETNYSGSLEQQAANQIEMIYRFSQKYPTEMKLISISLKTPVFKSHLAMDQKAAGNRAMYELLKKCADEGLLRTNSFELSRNIIFDTIQSYEVELEKETSSVEKLPFQTILEMLMAGLMTPEANQRWLNNN
ncbi:TetR/AcrR family transcriptional regulator [Pediococcus argentinicus]|uniref:HTH tetR-type domain-containing protein n=1 Tax=Pediococcus argentinicus TaxID=480391 RepID=A0A0R2NNZ0_9LACO|nr:TetR/AcrR family transcriptional regulator [Pediococcus argentinicus]KRO26144.1 hypothetical protein IV88_GL000604 [Pediococcus argentinicus]NKZ21650.1 TetR/AcrR family transcriptional regulator [Pediococcus argentinicus]GEP18763.1 TetR family transcriptional regulator [Pediococcus argentinicus]